MRLLDELGLGQHRALFEEEELTEPLLRSMGPLLLDNLVELGLTIAEAHKISEALAAPHTTATTAESSPKFAVRVAALQQELFCEDLQPPEGAEQWPEELLVRFFESGGEDVPKPPTEATVRADAMFSSACHCCTSTSAATSSLPRAATSSPRAATSSQRAVACTPQRASSTSSGPILGSLPVKWQGFEAAYEYREGATVADLKAWIHSKTTVSPVRQKLMGWSTRKYSDETPLASLKLSAVSVAAAPN